MIESLETESLGVKVNNRQAINEPNIRLRKNNEPNKKTDQIETF